MRRLPGTAAQLHHLLASAQVGNSERLGAWVDPPGKSAVVRGLRSRVRCPAAGVIARRRIDGETGGRHPPGGAAPDRQRAARWRVETTSRSHRCRVIQSQTRLRRDAGELPNIVDSVKLGISLVSARWRSHRTRGLEGRSRSRWKKLVPVAEEEAAGFVSPLRRRSPEHFLGWPMDSRRTIAAPRGAAARGPPDRRSATSPAT
jgi:hypothetical protein